MSNMINLKCQGKFPNSALLLKLFQMESSNGHYKAATDSILCSDQSCCTTTNCLPSVWHCKSLDRIKVDLPIGWRHAIPDMCVTSVAFWEFLFAIHSYYLHSKYAYGVSVTKLKKSVVLHFCAFDCYSLIYGLLSITISFKPKPQLINIFS